MSAERRLAAIMFTDMVGYSALSQKDEALALELLEEHYQLLRPVVAEHGGREIKTIGDSLLVAFASSLQAVRCAIAMQKVLSIHNASASEARAVEIRIGVHLGDVEYREGDVFGDGVNIASRIEPLAESGGICVTRSVTEQVEGKIEAEFVSFGEQALKNIARPVEVYQVMLPWHDEPRSAARQPGDSRAQQSLDEHSIAVLPFANMSPDPENEYFSDGLTEELIDALTKLKDLQVISRTSAFHFKGKDMPMRQISEELGVDHVLEGSVRKADGRVRVTAQLIDVVNDVHLWSDKYDRDLADIFAVQDEIARAIVEALQGPLLGERPEQLVAQATEDMDAYHAYLRGRYLLAKRTKASLEAALDRFGEALDRDPAYAQAYAQRANGLFLLVEYGHAWPDDVLTQAQRDLADALAIDSTLVMAQAIDALLTFYQDWDWTAAERKLQRMIADHPDNPLPHYHYAWNILFPQTRFEEALSEMQRALELDPLSLIMNRNLGAVYWGARRYEDAEAQLRRTLELDERFALTHLCLGQVHADQGRYEDALTAFRREAEVGTDRALAHGAIAVALARLGQEETAEETLAQLAQRAPDVLHGPYALAIAYAQLGRADDCLAWLERAFERRDPQLRFLKAHLHSDNVRSDPRYAEAVRRIGLEP